LNLLMNLAIGQRLVAVDALLKEIFYD